MSRLAHLIERQEELLRSSKPNRQSYKANFTLAALDAIYSASDGNCEICQRPSKRRLALDHDHETGRLRGLLCMFCNTALGKFRDDPAVLQRAIDYLKRNGK